MRGAGAEVTQEIRRLLGQPRQMSIDERRRAEDDVLSENELSADGFDRLLLGGDVAGHVLAGFAVFRALGEIVRPEQLDRLNGALAND